MQSQEGTIYDGKITGLTTFGAFVKLSNGETGMVHISEVAPVYVRDIKEYLTEGQEVKVKVIGINEANKISLSIKQALPQSDTDDAKKKQYPPKNRDNHNQGGRDRAPRQNYDNRNSRRNSAPSAPLTFEDMMAKFKQESDEKMSALKRSGEQRSSRRGNR